MTHKSNISGAARTLRVFGAVVAAGGLFSCGGQDGELGTETHDADHYSGVGADAAEGGDLMSSDNQIEAHARVPGLKAERWDALVSVVGPEMATELWSNTSDPVMPVYELQLENGNTVEWAEVRRGLVGIRETGPAALTLPIDTAVAGASAAEVFLALAPELPVPNELEELSARQADMANIYLELALAQDRFPEFANSNIRSPETIQTLDSVPETIGLPDGVEQLGSGLNSTLCFQGNGCGSCPSGNDWSVTQNNRTSASVIPRSDQNTVVSLGCTQTGQITHIVEYYDWWGEGWVMWIQYDLSAGWHTGTQLLQLDGGAEDFDVEVRMAGFSSGDKGSQCACGWNDD
jgi:hypothetical protein